ncbi:putative hydrophobic protein (TIGR00341 family) [Bacillus pakistanensis]|uniref:Hydrophobic protein (TIGR00341 family) n=1 Tax=Rossellomorea pakistanensis TaxID=992288 RepID=A0ABS2NI44_9BACI|nr:TIGR00341 family protein [Bacillus pakistanensis]MBM7587470.1 putative hydrophobic protein (TIGR00341 family) [Bacillus pakistanensis]
MELQLIDIYSPNDFEYLNILLQEFPHISYWKSNVKENESWVRILVEKEDSERILNYLEKVSHENRGFQAMLSSIKAYVPSEYNENNQKNKEAEMERASKHELYSIVHSSGEINASFTWFTIFAAIVATVGIIQNSPGLVIGANVIDPSIGPILGISFASILGDQKLARQSILTSLFGLSIPFMISVLFGFYFDLPVNSNEFISQTSVQIIDIVVAIAAGAAGALSFVKRSQGQLVGVMVSLTVLPPTVVLGMMIGAGNWQGVITPLLLLLININAIFLSAILVFWLSGIKPINWRDIEEANISRKYSLAFTSIFAIIFVIAVVYLHL